MTVVLLISLEYCCYTTLWNAEVVVWPFTAMNLYWVLCVAHAWAQKFTVRQQDHCRSVTYLTVLLSYQDLGRRRTETMHHSEWAALSPRLLTALLESGISVYALAFVLEARILSTRWNKDCVMWHVPQWLFWETITVSHVGTVFLRHGVYIVSYSDWVMV